MEDGRKRFGEMFEMFGIASALGRPIWTPDRVNRGPQEPAPPRRRDGKKVKRRRKIAKASRQMNRRRPGASPRKRKGRL